MKAPTIEYQNFRVYNAYNWILKTYVKQGFYILFHDDNK